MPRKGESEEKNQANCHSNLQQQHTPEKKLLQFLRITHTFIQ